MNRIYYSDDIDKVLSKLDLSRLKGFVGIKLHFGEKGCNTYLDPSIVKKVYDEVVSKGHEAKLVETNVLYKGARTTSTSHLKVAHEHGFDFAEIDFLDGEYGKDFIEVELEEGVVKSAKLGAGLNRYDSLVVVTHFKGHSFAGYGGVFKNLGMGFGSRAGKLHMHASVSPIIDQNVCTACGLCAKRCDFNAITLDPKAKIDASKCAGCAMCIAVCPSGAVNVPWGAKTNELLQKGIVDYASAVFKIIPKDRCIFINVAKNITEECDCMGISQEPLMEDIGILAGYDPVAVDKACLDMVGERFMKMNPHDKMLQVVYAEKKGLGKSEYDLVKVD